MKGDVLSLNDLKRSSVPWVIELFKAVENASSPNKRVFLSTSLIPLEGFTNFLQELKSHNNMDKVRVLVNLDKNANVDLKAIYSKDLTLTVVKDGAMNAYLSIPVTFKENIHISSTTTKVVNNKTISYLGLSLRDETINPGTEKPQELGMNIKDPQNSSVLRRLKLKYVINYLTKQDWGNFFDYFRFSWRSSKLLI